MTAKLLDATGQKTFALILDKGEEAVSALTEFARARRVGAAHFTAIGAFSELTLGYFDRGRKDYKRMPLKEQVEVLSLIGDIALDGDAPKVHAHVVVGRSDGTKAGSPATSKNKRPAIDPPKGKVLVHAALSRPGMESSSSSMAP